MSTRGFYWSYRRGWIDGAKGSAISKEHSEHSEYGAEYLAGFEDGRRAELEAMSKTQKRLGHTPLILRAQEVDTFWEGEDQIGKVPASNEEVRND